MTSSVWTSERPQYVPIIRKRPINDPRFVQIRKRPMNNRRITGARVPIGRSVRVSDPPSDLLIEDTRWRCACGDRRRVSNTHDTTSGPQRETPAGSVRGRGRGVRRRARRNILVGLWLITLVR